MEYSKIPNLDSNDCYSVADEGVFMTYLTDSSCIDHEVIHLSWYILDYYGIKISADNNEIQAYLFEYIKSNIVKLMSLNKFNLKK